MAARRVSSSRPRRCLRCRPAQWQSRRILCSHQRKVVRFQSEKSYQQEMDEMRRELAVLMEDHTLSDLLKKHSELWNVIEGHNYEAIRILESLKLHEMATNDLQESMQENEDDIQLERSRSQELEVIISTLNGNISQLQARFPEDKKAVLQRCQHSVQEKYQCQIDEIQNQHNSTKLEFDNIRELQAKVTKSRPEQERQLETKHIERMKIMLEKETDALLKNKTEWTCLKRSELEKEQAEFKSSLRQKIESELKEKFQREMEMRISTA